nr:MAG TPA: hypothetical protein [Crassvirales sp.]
MHILPDCTLGIPIKDLKVTIPQNDPLTAEEIEEIKKAIVTIFENSDNNDYFGLNIKLDVKTLGAITISSDKEFVYAVLSATGEQ